MDEPDYISDDGAGAGGDVKELTLRRETDMPDSLLAGTERRDRHELFRERRVCQIAISGEWLMAMLTNGFHGDEAYEVHGGVPEDTQIMSAYVDADHIVRPFIVSDEFEPHAEGEDPPRFDILMSKPGKPCVLKVPPGTIAAIKDKLA